LFALLAACCASVLIGSGSRNQFLLFVILVRCKIICYARRDSLFPGTRTITV
jgi:hypothetical protein